MHTYVIGTRTIHFRLKWKFLFAVVERFRLCVCHLLMRPHQIYILVWSIKWNLCQINQIKYISVENKIQLFVRFRIRIYINERTHMWLCIVNCESTSIAYTNKHTTTMTTTYYKRTENREHFKRREINMRWNEWQFQKHVLTLTSSLCAVESRTPCTETVKPANNNSNAFDVYTE